MLLLGLLGLNAALYGSVLLNRWVLRQKAYEIVSPSRPQREIVRACVHYTRGSLRHARPETIAKMPFYMRWNYLYSRLRPGPMSVMTYGLHHLGPCQSSSRFFLAMMQAHGIPARPLAMHSPDLRGCHSVVEVEYDGVKGIVDPSYGIVYQHPDGRPATREELRTDHELFLANARTGWLHSVGPYSDPTRRRSSYPTDLYTFDRTYYFNYGNFGPLRWAVHDGLRLLFGEEGPMLLKRPIWYMYPALTIMACIDLLAVALGLLYLGWRRRHGRTPPRSLTYRPGKKPEPPPCFTPQPRRNADADTPMGCRGRGALRTCPR